MGVWCVRAASVRVVHPLSRPVPLGSIAPEIPARMKCGSINTHADMGVTQSSVPSGTPTMPAVNVVPSESSISRKEPVRR